MFYHGLQNFRLKDSRAWDVPVSGLGFRVLKFGCWVLQVLQVSYGNVDFKGLNITSTIRGLSK